MNEQMLPDNRAPQSKAASKETYTFRWALTVPFLLAFLVSAIAGVFYHPWDTVLEKSGVSVLAFENLGAQVDIDNLGEDAFFDRVDLMKYRIARFLFPESGDSLLTIYAKRLLSPIEDTANSISLAMAYSGFSKSASFIDPAFSSLIVIVFFLLFYLFQFGKDAAIKRLNYPEDAKGLAKLEKRVNIYCLEGAADYLFLFLCYWIMSGLHALNSSGLSVAVNNALNGGNPLVMLPLLLVVIALMAAFVLLVAALLICVLPYYFLMALPLFLLALLPVWVWTPLKVGLCLIMEVWIISGLFPRLYERLNLWNTLKGVCRVVFFIPYVLTWPIRKLFSLFF